MYESINYIYNIISSNNLKKIKANLVRISYLNLQQFPSIELYQFESVRVMFDLISWPTSTPL